MDFERARQIVQSEEIINVLWDGAPVWIEHLDAEKKKATVSPLDGALNPVEVPVAELVESPAPMQM
jgi:small acid-soluble spore protein H (minor)